MPANIDSMAYHGQTPWHGLGVEVPADVDSPRMLAAAGLDWRVEKVPLPTARKNLGEAATRFQLTRKARSASEVDIPLALVTGKYEPVQNDDAFRFFDPLIRERLARYETAGALGDGERIWVLVRLKDQLTVVPGDVVDRYLLLSNTHSGKESVTVQFTPIRVVCQNTLLLALKDGSSSIKLRHTGKVVSRLLDVGELVETTMKLYEHAAELFRLFARVQLDAKRLTRFLAELYPVANPDARPGATSTAHRYVEALFDQHDGISSIRHTLWAAYNAVIRYEDFRKPREAGPDRRLQRVWFGDSAALKLRALKVAERFALPSVN